MIRIYFDWCVLTNLKKGENAPPEFHVTSSILQRYSKDICLPYSHAHLSDLMRSYKKSDKGKMMTKRDLEFLSSLTNNHCLYHNPKSKDVRPILLEPKEYFYEMLANDKLIEELAEQDNLFALDDEFRMFLAPVELLMKSIPSGIQKDYVEKFVNRYPDIRPVFKNTLENNSYFNLFMDTVKFMLTYSKHSDFYVRLRETFKHFLQIDKTEILENDLFNYLDMKLQDPLVNMNFTELVELTESILPNKEKLTFSDRYNIVYLLLDLLGYSYDKKRTRVENMMDDLSHTFFGAHCDVFVTNDRDAYQKAKSVYEYFGIKTKVCLLKDFPVAFYSMFFLNNGYNYTPFVDQLIHQMRNSIIALQSIDVELNPVRVMIPERLFLSYFDRFQVNELPESIELFYYKKPSHSSRVYFWTEISELLRLLKLLLGMDIHYKGDLDENDTKAILSHDWNGRFWRYNDVLVRFFMHEEFGIALELDISVNSNHKLAS